MLVAKFKSLFVGKQLYLYSRQSARVTRQADFNNVTDTGNYRDKFTLNSSSKGTYYNVAGVSSNVCDSRLPVTELQGISTIY